MLNISSVVVAPRPPQAPAAKVQPVTAAKPSNAVSPENTGPTVAAVAAAEGNRVQTVATPGPMAPVEPAREAMAAEVQANVAAPTRLTAAPATVARAAPSTPAPQASAPTVQAASVNDLANPPPPSREVAELPPPGRRDSPAARFRGELPPEVKNPADAAIEQQVNNLIPSLWEASRVAVDVLIGEEAKAAAARAAEIAQNLNPQPYVPSGDQAIEAAQTYVAQTASPPEPQRPGANVQEQA